MGVALHLLPRPPVGRQAVRCEAPGGHRVHRDPVLRHLARRASSGSRQSPSGGRSRGRGSEAARPPSWTRRSRSAPSGALACPAGRPPRVSGAPALKTGRPAPTRLADCRAPRPVVGRPCWGPGCRPGRASTPPRREERPADRGRMCPPRMASPRPRSPPPRRRGAPESGSRRLRERPHGQARPQCRDRSRGSLPGRGRFFRRSRGPPPVEAR